MPEVLIACPLINVDRSATPIYSADAPFDALILYILQSRPKSNERNYCVPSPRRDGPKDIGDRTTPTVEPLDSTESRRRKLSRGKKEIRITNAYKGRAREE
jgi:hypothetical protein